MGPSRTLTKERGGGGSHDAAHDACVEHSLDAEDLCSLPAGHLVEETAVVVAAPAHVGSEGLVQTVEHLIQAAASHTIQAQDLRLG